MSQKLFSSEATDGITRDEAVAVVSKIFDTKNLDVIDFHIDPFSTEKLGYTAEHKLLRIEVEREVNNHRSRSNSVFFLKLIASNCNDYHERIFQEECEFFDKVLPLLRNFQMDRWAPQCYFVKNTALVLENLKLQGFQCATEKFTVGELKAAITALARFHASSILLEHKLKKPLKVAFPNFFKEKIFSNRFTSTTNWLAAGIEVAESVACDLGLDSKYVSMAYDYVLKENHLTDSGLKVFCHRDLWKNNIMFSKDEKSCRLLDFQVVAYASFATDIVQLLYLNLNKATRQKLEPFSVELYYSELEETLIKNGITSDEIISLGKVVEAVEENRIYGLTSAVMYEPVITLSGQLLEEFAKDPALNRYYMYDNRKDFVKKAMQMDDDYRDRVEESVKELVDYMKGFHGK